MRYSKLGSSPLNVSRVCLGTMTWGSQNTQADVDEQMDYALAQGINFVDTAELYAVPPTPETYGKTEVMIGNWLARHPERRSSFILASKIAGKGLGWIRGAADITGKSVIDAVDASLQRLQTDYIDLFQLHWPNRPHASFGQHHEGMIGFSHLDRQAIDADMVDILEGVQRCIDAGKIHYLGLSNESPWGISNLLRLSEKYGLPRPVSIQNEFSLLMQKDWPYTLEACVHEEIAYLPWSPLCTGALSGKYLNGAIPSGSRWSLSQRHGLFRHTEGVMSATEDLLALASKFGITPSQLALAWCDQVDGVTSTIIGATSLTQLKENIAAFNITLSADQLSEIRAVIKPHTAPF
ncbi:MAG TPA: aldo/keto reductase [Pseudomonadales bacterium]|nr:aldo/keto reductase [Pseudomonadales bacterium]